MRPKLTFIISLVFGVNPFVSASDGCPVLEGDFQPGGLLWGKTEPNARLEFNDVQVPVREDGTFLLGLGRDAPIEKELRIQETSRRTRERQRRQ